MTVLIQRHTQSPRSSMTSSHRTKTMVQQLEVCDDTGWNTVGIAAKPHWIDPITHPALEDNDVHIVARRLDNREILAQHRLRRLFQPRLFTLKHLEKLKPGCVHKAALSGVDAEPEDLVIVELVEVLLWPQRELP